VNTPATSAFSLHPVRIALGLRLLVIAVVLTLETLFLSFLIQQTPVMAATGFAADVHAAQHWLSRFLIAYAVAALLLFSLGRHQNLASIGSSEAAAPLSNGWGFAHVMTLPSFAWLSSSLYSDSTSVPFGLLALGWHANALVTAFTLFATLAPPSVWTRIALRHRRLLLYAIAPALGTVLAIQWSQALWHPAAGLTFWISLDMLRTVLPNVHADFSSLTLGTDRFAVMIADQCSGLEGMGLMLVFCASWLWFFRREYFFPRALLIIPAAMLLIFLFNAIRIAALVLIGDAGYARIAVVGFHSQAGWIAFNTAAFAVAVIAKRSAWLNRDAQARRTLGDTANRPAVRSDNPTAAYVMPLLIILAAGMLAHALSAGFDFLYPLRLLAGGAALWFYRRHYQSLRWGASWRALAVGLGIFVLWAVFDHYLNAAHGMPQALADVPPTARIGWIASRAIAASLTVPIAEELAYRGFLMRRFGAVEFETASFSAVRWPALLLSSLVFGITHGDLWLPGLIAGLAFGLLAIRTNKFGEAVVAHAVANACIAIDVIGFGQWQMW
jgi:exosortase E/protease (VPEID-CTERM system)